MMGWISDDNMDNEVRENSFKQLAKQFFKELITPNSLVECGNKTLLEAALAWEDEDTYKDYVTGKFDIKWADVDFVYTAMNISDHWMVLAMDIYRGHIFVFDSLSSYTPMTKLVNWLELLTVTVLSLLHYCDVDRSKSDLYTVRWKISRPMNVNIQHGSLDCGIFVIKLLKHLVTSTDPSVITQEKINEYRM
ncbi:uncharacterized protein LOC120067405 [Benincasa hispida]|uniref:uncharacterized protein LOC120067405 n=1 Tax=Benincasa hispida TaxID=102211 RepID=UPI0019004F8E|nr:uncharacterized protein LOC120067405 [Benincasa hispida]